MPPGRPPDELCPARQTRAGLTRYRDEGGKRAAVVYSLLGSTQLNGLDVEAYLRHVIERPVNWVEELLPWDVAVQLPAPRLAARSSVKRPCRQASTMPGVSRRSRRSRH